MDRPITVATMYENPAPMPVVDWVDFPKDLDFENFYQKALAMGITHTKVHGELLFDTAKIGPGEGVIIELGTYNGDGATYLAFGSKTARREKVFTIDVDRGHIWSLYTTQFYDRPPMQLFRGHMNWIMMGVQDWIIPIRASSVEASKFLNVKARAVIVDACHTYEGCACDIYYWEPVLIPGGYMIFHDYSQEGVTKAVQKYVIDSGKFEDLVVLDVMTAYAIKK